MRRLIAALLILEGLLTGVRVVTLVPTLTIYPALTIAILALRGLVGMFEFSSGWILLRGQPFGAALARGVLAVSAALFTLELGFDLAPSSLFHTYHWPAVGVYWVYALAAILVLARPDRP